MKLLKVEKAAAYATMAVMHRFSIFVKTEYCSGGDSDSGLSCAFSESILAFGWLLRYRVGLKFD